jgi:hypothetical protein
LLERFKGSGFSSMVAIDDYAAVLYAGKSIEAVLSWKSDATTYQIECIDGDRTFNPGVCKHCGSCSYGCVSPSASEASVAQLWVAREIGHLIASVTAGEKFVLEDLTRAIVTIVTEGWKDKSSAARALGVSLPEARRKIDFFDSFVIGLSAPNARVVLTAVAFDGNKAFVEKNRVQAIADFFDQLMLYSSHPHAAKSCIHVLVMRLKPVTKTRSKHASCRAWRAAFEHEMLVVVEVRGVTQVERKRLETG